MKVAHVRLNFLRITETFIYEEIKNLKKYEPIVFCIKTENLDKFPFKNIRSLSNLNPFSYLFNAGIWLWFKKCPYFVDVIRSESVAILHAQYGREGLYSIHLKEKTKIPLITNFRGWDASTIPTQNPRIYDRLFEIGDLFLVRSNDMKKDLIKLGCPEKKLRVHHSAIDLDKFEFRPRKPVDKNENIRILLVGRFTETKGIPYALSAVAKVKKKYKNIVFTIIGDGILKPQIKNLVKKLNLMNEVRLLGFVPHNQVIKEMLNSHIFILPSLTDRKGEKEGTANVFAEAQATGMPTIGTYHAGIPEVVLDGKTGFLVKEKDADELAKKLEYLIEHQDLWEIFGKNGRKHVEREFNIKIQTKKLEKIYDEILSS
jgi:colanic acid/amylovoran biosynthesis glycosyltransferase